jgi:5,10-methylene-tetrahydrofolate dehydrogenase/methenyl tetrahydrofolate cyclohydrolase
MQILDGKKCASAYKETIAAEVIEGTSKVLRKPHVAAVLVGNDVASET